MYFNDFPCMRQMQMPSSGQYYQNMQTSPAMPTGIPTGPSTGSVLPLTSPSSISASQSVPTTIQNPNYLPGFLKKFIGMSIRIEYLIGTNAPLVDRTGTLLDVGASYVLMRIAETDDLQISDLYSIKFVTIYQ